jgi:hypothetical protein
MTTVIDHDALPETCAEDGHIDGCPGRAGGDHEAKFVGGPFVSLPLNAMRCVVCGHRLDDMGGCDDCAGDREAAMWEASDDD